ncbi:MAG: hypothetical protein AM325_009815 [Candidatus Thorarchaeota archaeon SMTZ1-45]|nr:MAG: hypothetical protein AM325_11395 [Candidatus Thorarchaeota archaeon SMTZ1-45]
MNVKRYVIICLIGFSLILTVIPFSTPRSHHEDYNNREATIIQNINEVNVGGFIISQIQQQGVIEPVSMLQSAYQTTEISKGLSDTGTNTTGNITIDGANGWFVNSTEIEIANLERLYSVNGTFDDGSDPWIPFSNDGGSNTQINSYNSTGEYIVCQNIGNYNPGLGGSYLHSEDSEAAWEQVITNTPESVSFRMEFDFRYVTGPLDPEGDNTFQGDFGVYWQLASEAWYYPLQELNSRETWYSVSHDFTVDPGLSTFSIYVGLWIGWADMWIYVNTDYDDDPLGEPDGHENAENVTIYIDNIELKSLTSLGFDDVDLTFHAGSFSAPVSGIGTGTATISNPDFWTASPLEYQITANATVTFTYSVTTLFQRYINSSWTTDLSKKGVAYSITSGQNSDLTFYTYITQPSGYSDSTIDIFYPKDWENTTVWDPLMNNITDSCVITSGVLHIPTSELSRSGWWEINLNSWNYAKNISVQVFDQSIGGWSENSLFRPGNDTRVQVEIGTASVTPAGGDPVNITWILPDEAIWIIDSIILVGGAATSSSWTFGSSNTTAGEWSIDVLWTNGTEIAFESVTFDLYHSASIVATYPLIETDYGLTISNLITYRDADTNEYLLDDSVKIEANWSSTIISFTQNYAKNWWEADFDTSLLGGGQFNVIVTATRPFFDAVSTQFTVISMYETSIEILNAGSIPIENGLNEVFTAQIDYEFLNGTGIPGAQPIVTFTGPGGGLSWTNFVDNNNGHYSVDIICDIATSYEVTITLSKPYHYNSSDSFTLIISETGTELELLNGTADVIQYGNSYRLVVEYRNSTGQGLSGANLEIVSITPQTGLDNGSFILITEGYYEITFTPTTTGTYSIVIRASLFNHETQYATFTLTGVVIPTILTAIPPSATVAVNQTFTLQLLFQDESLNQINSATISVLDPPSGIFISGATPIGSGLYNITLRSSDISVYNLLFRASAVNYQSSIMRFTLSVTAIQTTLEILNAGLIPIEIGLNEIFSVQMSYQLLNGSGVAGAFPTIIFTGPQEGLLWTNFIDNDTGLYSVDIKCNISAIYGITITLSKEYHYNTSDAFTLIIGETESELQLLNGTVDVVLFGSSYILVVEYRNSTGTGLVGADLQVVTITPATGLTHGGFSHIVDGYYQITLTPIAAGAFSIVISASILNHKTKYATFTLTATGIPTILTSLPSSASIALDQNFTVQLHLQDDSLNPIENANFTVTNPPSGLIISEVVLVGPGTGLYNFTLTPLAIGTFNVLFRSSADNYQSSSAAFTLIVTQIETRIVFEGDVSSALVEFEEPYTLIVYYYRADVTPSVNIVGANVSVLTQDPGLVIAVESYTGYYLITIRGQALGTWSLTITANKTDHYTSTKQFLFQVQEIDTAISGSSPFDDLLIGRSYLFNFSYMFESNSSNIYEATVVPLGEGADWVTFTELGSGEYSVNMTPQALGDYSVLLTFEKTGFETATFRLRFSVAEVPVTIEVLQGLRGSEGLITTLMVRITEADTGAPVTGATVAYNIRRTDGVRIYEQDIVMPESATPGVYIAALDMPSADGTYYVVISFDATNFILNEPLVMLLQPGRDVGTMIVMTVRNYYWVFIGLGMVVVGLAYRRTARKRRIKQNKITLAIKKRFDDVKSLLGVIVLHKDSGLPVYSKILREGLEEAVISAFITAITSFRGEFDIETTSEEWGLIPISDIVRVVSTNKLICAFITTGNPSPEQREKMIKFAKTVGFIFDETMEDVPVVVLNHHTTKRFNSLFDEILDGALLRTYKLDESKKFPTSTCADERIARKQGEEFKLEELASEISACGLEEGRVYQAIMRALENQLLITTDESPFATDIIRAPETVEEEG